MVLKPNKYEHFSTTAPSKTAETQIEDQYYSKLQESPKLDRIELRERAQQNQVLISEIAKHLSYFYHVGAHNQRLSLSTDKLHADTTKKTLQMRKVLQDSHYIDKFTQSRPV